MHSLKVRKMEQDEEISDYFIFFKSEMEEQKVPKKRWANKLRVALSKKYHPTLQTLTQDQRNDWDTL